LEATEAEPEGSDQDLIDELQAMVERGMEAMAAPPPAVEPAVAQGTLAPQTLERPLRPGEVSLDELERAFRETAIEVAPAPVPAKQPEPHAAAVKHAKPAAKKPLIDPEA